MFLIDDGLVASRSGQPQRAFRDRQAAEGSVLIRLSLGRNSRFLIEPDNRIGNTVTVAEIRGRDRGGLLRQFNREIFRAFLDHSAGNGVHAHRKPHG